MLITFLTINGVNCFLLGKQSYVEINKIGQGRPSLLIMFLFFCFRTFRNLVGFQGVEITGLEVLCKDLTPGPTV